MSVKPRILVTRKLPLEVHERLKLEFDAELNYDDSPYSSDELLQKSNQFDGLLVVATEKCDAQFISALPASIRIIATYSVGYDHIDIDAARAKGIAVTNTPDVLTDATADIALLLLLGAARGAYWGEQMVRKATWGAWAPTTPLGLDVGGKRLGIYGMGRIGQAVAHRARAFGMEIHYHKRTRLDASEENGAIFHEDFGEFLGVCDFLSINCASSKTTRGSINEAAIARLPNGAVIVNTARGDIVDDDALIAALQSGKVAAAGLDVFNNEPNLDPRYRDLENVFLLPHLGSATPQTRIDMGMRAIDNLAAFFNGKNPRDLLTQ